MKRFSRLFLVPPVIVALMALAYLLVFMLERSLDHMLGPAVVAGEFKIPMLYQLVLTAGMIAAGIFRFWRFHPVGNAPYAAWLMTSPWTYRRPLPLGPLHLAWQDLLILAAAFLLERFHLHFAGPLPVIAFLAAYLLSATAIQFYTQPQRLVLLLIAGLPVPLLLLHVPRAQWWILAVLAFLYPIAAYVTHASLRHFPWRLHQPRPQSEAAEWLFKRLGPVDSRFKLSFIAAVTISALAAWWIFCGTFCAPFLPAVESWHELRSLFLVVGIFVAVFRLIVYANAYWPPFSLAGRFATGRLIIPGYDVIFIAPLLVLPACILIPGLFLLDVNQPLVCGLFVFFTLFPVLAVGPSLYRWKLTGNHRIIESAQAPRTTLRTRTKSSPEIRFTFFQ